MLKGIWIASLSTILHANAMALAPGVHCAGGLNDDRTISAITQHFDHLEFLLPTVPKEQQQAMGDLAKQGFGAGLDGIDPAFAEKAVKELKANRYYYLQRARTAIKSARAAVGIILVDSKSLGRDQYIGLGFPHWFYDDEYEDADAVKVDHAAWALSAIESMELALAEFLLEDAQAKQPLLPDTARQGLDGNSSGYVANLGMYMQCKLADIMVHTQKARGAGRADQKVK